MIPENVASAYLESGGQVGIKRFIIKIDVESIYVNTYMMVIYDLNIPENPVFSFITPGLSKVVILILNEEQYTSLKTQLCPHA